MPLPTRIPASVDPQQLSPDDQLLYAASYGMVMTLIRGIRDGASLNGTDEQRRTPLHRAVDAPLPTNDAVEMVRQLRRSGARDDLPDRHGDTPLMLARRLGKSEEVIAALSAPVNPDAMLLLVLDQWTSSARGYDQRCRQALRLGADPWAPHPDHRQPLLYTAVSLDRGGALARFHQQGLDLDRPLSDDGNTPLLVAAQEGKLIATYALLHAGANVQHANRRGNTALHLGLYSPSLVAALLDAGANPERTNHDGVSVWARLAQHEQDAGSPSEVTVLAQTRRVLTERWVKHERTVLRAALNASLTGVTAPSTGTVRSRL